MPRCDVDAPKFKFLNTISSKRAAKVLGVKVGTLASWRCYRPEYLPFLKVGGRVRYRVIDVKKLLTKNN